MVSAVTLVEAEIEPQALTTTPSVSAPSPGHYVRGAERSDLAQSHPGMGRAGHEDRALDEQHGPFTPV